MPLYDFVGTCGLEFEQVVPIGTEEVSCRCDEKKCIANRDEIIRLRGYSVKYGGSHAQAFSPPVIYMNAKGEMRFPGHSESKETKRLEKLGFERKELKTIHEIRKFEASMNQKERVKYDRFITAKNARFAAQQRPNRDELRQALATGRMVMRDAETGEKYVGEINEKQKGVIRAAMEYTDNRRTSDPNFDAGFHLDAFSNDFSNREEHRDISTGWKGRKG